LPLISFLPPLFLRPLPHSFVFRSGLAFIDYSHFVQSLPFFVSSFQFTIPTEHSSAVGCPNESRSAKEQPIHLRLSKGHPTDELNERPLEGPISTARSYYTEIRNRTLHLSSNQICRFNT
jgi:hypothetical protein